MKAAASVVLALALVAAPAVHAQPPTGLQQRVEAKLREAGPGTRFGLVVADESGRELVAVSPEGRFMPASNTKIFTTAALYATVPGVDAPDAAGGAAVRLEKRGGREPDLVLEGHGDARLSSAPECLVDCLSALADAVAAATRKVHDVIGDDTLFPDERWSPGMSWNNIPTRSGTGISALSLDDNEFVVRVSPSAAGQPLRIEALPYYVIDNRASTVAAGAPTLDVARMPGSNLLRVTGTIAAGAAPEVLRLGIDDPAHFAAWRLRQLLESRGVKVTGAVLVRHRPRVPGEGPPAPNPSLARLTPPPLAADVVITNKTSQNLHAELMLRRVALHRGTGAVADGVAAVREMLTRAGVARAAYDFSDGSGMSTYNRVAPRGTVQFLRWVAAQPWGAAWRASLPVGGVDGTLARRFKGSPLEGKLFAKTGSINASTALSGYMIAKSGRTLAFAAFANDIPEGAGATKAIDAALELIALEN